MEGKEVLEAIFMYVTEGILVTNQLGEIVRINPSAEKMLGYEKDELVGQKIETLLPTRFEANHVKHRSEFNKNAHPREMGKGKNLFAKRKDGSEFPVEISLSPYKTNDESFVIAFIVDATFRKKAEEDYALFSSIISSSDDAIISKTLDGKITSWNHGAQKIFGYRSEEIIGRNILLLIPKHLHTEEEAIKSKIHKGEIIDHYKTQRIRKDGTIIHVSLTISPLKDHQGNIVGASKILRDFTKQVEVEEKLISEEKKIRKTLDNMMEGIQIHDFNWRYTYVNNALVKYSHYSKEELIGYSIMEKYPGIEKTDLFKVMERCMNERTVEQLETEFTFPNGSKGYFELSIQPVPEGIFILSIDISERNRAQKEQKKSETYYQSIIQQANDTIYIVDSSEKPKIIEINQSGCDLLGYTKDEILQLTTYDIIFESEFNSSTLLIDELRKGKSIRNERKLKRKDGTAVEVEFSAKKMADGNILIVARDVSERKKAEEKLKLSEAYYRSIIEQANDGIYITDQGITGKFIDINPSGCKMLGYTKEEFLKLNPIDIIFEEELINNPIKMDEIKSGATVRNERMLKRKDGTVVYTESNGKMLEDGNFIVFVRDITERKKIEKEILALNESLENRVKERTQELESFSYSVSHDLRAPLRAVNGYAQMLYEDYGSKLDEEGHRVIQTIKYNASKMGTLIDDLLAFSRLGRRNVQKTEVDLNELVHHVLDEINKLVVHVAKIEVEKLHIVKADYGLLSQAIFNLISNAIKYSAKKDKPLIQISTKEKNGEIEFLVKDNGAGFDMAYANKLFGVFQRLHSHEEFEGTGVGLAIVQRVIYKHGGKVGAEGKINEGATFYFTLTNN